VTAAERPKVFGIGLNKTGTKTLARYLRQLGYRHRSYDSNNVYESPSFDLYAAGETEALLSIADEFDSAEDWPWPLLFRDLDKRYPTAKFVLTVRSSAERWFRSLCNMAVRLGPLPLYEKMVYGYSMPQGHFEELADIYHRHEQEVLAHFQGRPEKLLRICWDDGDAEVERLAQFLGAQAGALQPAHVNASPKRLYEGDSLPIAHINRIAYQQFYGPKSLPSRVAGRLRRLVAAEG
jgi:hypothetical protein